MICEHLRELEAAVKASGAVETYRGQVWTDNFREWVYFDVVIDVEAVKKRFKLAPSVKVAENLDPKSGTERGLECDVCHDAVMGYLEGKRKFP